MPLHRLFRNRKLLRNILIRAALEKGNTADAQKLIKQMSDTGVDPDIATHAIILDHTFRTSFLGQDLSQEELEEKAIASIKDLEKHGRHDSGSLALYDDIGKKGH